MILKEEKVQRRRGEDRDKKLERGMCEKEKERSKESKGDRERKKERERWRRERVCMISAYFN